VIINIRGPSGSGKSTVVRKIMDRYPGMLRHFIPGRKQPIGYLLTHPTRKKRLAVIGHYETDCGGCDTINKVEDTFHYVRLAASKGYDVLFEGLLMGYEWKRTIRLPEVAPLIVIAMDLSVEECVESVRERRRATAAKKGREPRPETEKFIQNIESKGRQVMLSVPKLERHGIDVRVLDREASEAAIVEAFGL
jgi:thymidylate kinase